jgi:hypothetical protein
VGSNPTLTAISIHVAIDLDQLPPDKLGAVRNLLEAMVDRFEHKLATAEIDDEPVTDEKRPEIEASRRWD